MRILIPLSFIALLALTYIYLYPGSQALLDGRTDTVMSDGSDPASLPYAYDLLIQAWRNYPSRFFYGSVYLDGVDPERGTPAWHPWNERWLVLLGSTFVPLEQLTTVLVVFLILLDALSMYLLGSYLRWPKTVSTAMAVAWAFCCYTRARAKVHMAFVGTYHLPLIFLSLFLVVRGRSKRSLGAAALALLLAGTVAHHYLITCVFLSPLFVVFVLIQPEFLKNPRQISQRLILASLPLILFMGWNYAMPVPSNAKITAEESMMQGVTKDQELQTNLLFLNTYYARLTDYLAGDVSLASDGTELNPLRALVNDFTQHDLGQGNAHERTNGIRWSILILSVCALIALIRGRYRSEATIRNNLIFFFFFALFTLWLSLSPNIPVENGGASYWIFSIFPKIRVASRAGLNVHFSLLMIAGFFLAHLQRWRKVVLFPGLLILVMVLDYPPLQSMPMAPIAPRYTALQRDQGACGMGMAFPFFNPWVAMNVMYSFAQRMRGSDCPILNSSFNMAHIRWMTSRFPPSFDFLNQLSSQPAAGDLLEKIARCVPLNWIAFHETTPQAWAQEMCRRLAWNWNADMTCVAPNHAQAQIRYPEQCGF